MADKFIGLCSSAFHGFELALHRCQLPLHRSGLAFNLPPCAIEDSGLYRPNHHEEETEQPHPPIGLHRHGGKFGDAYGMLITACALLISGGVTSYGWACIDRGLRFGGCCPIGAGSLLGAAACGSGAIGCFSGRRRACLHGDEEHSERQVFHGGNYTLAAFPVQNTGSYLQSRPALGEWVFRGARSGAPRRGFTRRLVATLPRLCLRRWRAPQFKVKGKIKTTVKGDGRECSSHTGRWWRFLAGLVMLAAGMGSFDCA